MSRDVLEKLKKDVRSLLVSSKTGLVPDQLKRDYFNMFGHPMPLKQLGFRNVMDMAKEMPDVISVNFGPDGSIYLKGLNNEVTQNIGELVAKQKMSKTKKKTKMGGFNSFPPFYLHGSTPVFLPRRGCAPPSLPAHLRMQLRHLLSQGPLRLSDLEVSYLRFFGRPLRIHEFGFCSTEEMLQAVTDLVVIQPGRLGSVLKLRELALPRPLRPLNSFQRSVSTKSASHVSDGSKSRRSNSNPPEPTKPSAVILERESLQDQSSETTWDSVLKESVVNCPKMPEQSRPELSQDPGFFHKRVVELEEELRQQILENGVAGTVSQDLKDKLRKVVGQRSGGLSIHELPAEYKKLFGEDIPFLQSGFVSVTELVGALSDTFLMKPAEGDSGFHWIVDIKNLDDGQLDLEEVKESRDHIRSFYFSSGRSCWEQGEQGEDDDVTDDVTDDKEGLESTDISTTYETMSEIYPTIQGYCRSVVPLDALQNERLKPPTRHDAHELIVVLVEEVESPGNFYIRFSENQEARAMEDMMFEMRRCYTCPEVSERYRLLEPFIRQGQTCCVSTKGMWFYRVVIHRVLNPTQVEVYYVDFGNIIVVPSDRLKFLKSSYSVLPAQAVPSSLAGIKPASGVWTPEATASFQKMCSDRALVGALDGYAGDVLQLYLCDTHTDQDIYVHSVLINQGHGVSCSITALCERVTPASLYLGEGMVDLPEVNQELIAADTLHSPERSTEAPQIDEEEEMPGLELVEESEVITDIQRDNQVSSLLDDPTLSCSDQSRTSADEPSTVSTISPAVGPPDLIQARTHPAHQEAELKESVTPKDTPSSLPCLQSPLILRSLHTSPLGQILDSFQGSPVSLLYLRNSGPMFPLFGTR